jgi:SDR family mycofactocin-dependent oxidoreductase
MHSTSRPADGTRRTLLTTGAPAAGLLAGLPTDATSQDKPSSARPLSGQVALVTGGARGIGRAVAVRLAREGCDVALVDVAAPIKSVPYALATPADLAEASRQVQETGRRALTLRADVRDRSSMVKAVETTLSDLGRLGIVVANAGVLTFGLLHEMSDAQWADVIDVNLTGVARTLQAALPHMIKRSYGRIVVVNSCNSRFGSPQSASYNASKWGVLGLVKCAAVEYARQGITVNAINPTGVRTPMNLNPATLSWSNPERPSVESLDHYLRSSLNAQNIGLIEPEDVAAAVPFLCSPDASRITGEAIDVAAGANVRWNS